MGGDRWYESDKTDQTDDTLKAYSEAVEEYLKEKGKTGYLLGYPAIHLNTAMQICILDPHNEVPADILLFADIVGDFMDTKELSLLDKDKYQHEYNEQEEKYNISFEITDINGDIQEFSGEFNREANITSIKGV